MSDRGCTAFGLAMSRLGFTATALARELGCSRSTISHVLAGDRPFGPELRARLRGLGFADSDLSTEPIDLADVPPGVVADAARAAVAADRMRQGLPAVVTDEQVLEAVARILARALLDLPARAEAGAA